MNAQEKKSECEQAKVQGATGYARAPETPPAPDAGSDRVAPADAAKKKPLPIVEIENLEDDAKGG
jgi:hypothetical protein